MTRDHEWTSRSGLRWRPGLNSDLCAECGSTPDVHPPAVEFIADELHRVEMERLGGQEQLIWDDCLYASEHRGLARAIAQRLRL